VSEPYPGVTEQEAKEVFNAQNNTIKMTTGIKMMSPVQNYLRYFISFLLALPSLIMGIYSIQYKLTDSDMTSVW
jgi:hypothetical protein